MLKKLHFVPPHRSLGGDKGMMLTLSVAKLDAASPGGEPDDRERYERAKRWIMEHGHCGPMASEIAIDEGENHIYFIEGRNRFAALRALAQCGP